MKVPQLVNIRAKNAPAGKVLYIGRPKDNRRNHFGNPFNHLESSKATIKVASRDEAVDFCREWLDGTAHQEVEPERRQWILDNLSQVREADAVSCWCAPARCHGEVLIEKATGVAPAPRVTKSKSLPLPEPTGEQARGSQLDLFA